MDVAEPLDVRKNLVGSGYRAGGLECVADQNHTGLAVARTDIEVGRPYPDVAGDFEIAGDAPQPRHRRIQRRCRRALDLLQPGVVELAIDKQIGPHRIADRKQRQIGYPFAGAFREIGEGGKLERRAADRRDIKSE